MTAAGPGRGNGPNGPYPRSVVALGGGTGMPAVLRGLKTLVCNGETGALTAVVTMSDDGGSSGRLRRTQGLPPPGDVRNCLVALSAEEDLLAGLFQHRYGDDAELHGHSLGNLILAALAEQTGSFLKAVEVTSRVLRTVGRILPATLEDVTLEALLEDGSRLVGESAIGACQQPIERVRLVPESPAPTPGVAEAIEQADLVVLGPGSLFTSLVPNLLVGEISRALRETSAVRVLVGNLVSEGGEGFGLELSDHLQVLDGHAGGRIVDVLLAHRGSIDEQVRVRYEKEGATPSGPVDEQSVDVRVVYRDLVAPGPKLRHEPSATAAGLLHAFCEQRALKPAEPRR